MCSVLLFWSVDNDSIGVSGDLGSQFWIWNDSDYRKSSPCTTKTKDCSIYRDLCTSASVSVTDGYEHGSITCFLCAQVNCDATIFKIVGVDWIALETFVIIFIVKNISIQFVKRSENRMTSYLAHFISQSGCIISLGNCPDCVWEF